jgi:hypothetical protein
MTDSRLDGWLAALDERHLADLTPREVVRALRALSSCYVERRGKLAAGGALDSSGKRAAFALFYGPLHFLVVREIVRALPAALGPIDTLIDLGCGTGAAGAAWASEAPTQRIAGVDRNGWAVSEATGTYRAFGLSGRAKQGDLLRIRLDPGPGDAILAAYTINELQDSARRELLQRLLAGHERGARLLVIEPIARRLGAWWPEWADAFQRAGGRADDWRFARPLPPRQRDLAKAAGLDPRELTARSLWLGTANPNAQLSTPKLQLPTPKRQRPSF